MSSANNKFPDFSVQKYLSKLLKIVSVSERKIIGRLKCIDNLGNLFLTETVEVFEKQGDYSYSFNLYNNNSEHLFSFESDKNQYQVYSPSIIPKNEIKQIFILKE